MAEPNHQRLGSDLALTRYTGIPAAVPLDAADSWGTLDLSVVAGGQGGLRLTSLPLDLRKVSGRENLAQALVIRLLTPVGALAPLGHPQFGSRLVSLIGQLNNETTRNLARLYTLEALAAEPRIRRVVNLDVQVVPGAPEVIRIGFHVLPIDDAEPLPLALEVAL